MLLIIASASDEAAIALSKRWRDEPALVLTPRDLSQLGWRYRVGAIDKSVAVASGTRIVARQIRGVLTRLAWIDPRSLEHIVTEDREYVAAEMAAFLLAWLTELKCPVINRPSTTCLCGPGWSAAQWEQAAVQAGIRAVLRPTGGTDTIAVTVAGHEILGQAPVKIKDSLIRLAAIAGVEFMTVHLNSREPVLERVDLWPDVSDSVTADVLLNLFDAQVPA